MNDKDFFDSLDSYSPEEIESKLLKIIETEINKDVSDMELVDKSLYELEKRSPAEIPDIDPRFLTKKKETKKLLLKMTALVAALVTLLSIVAFATSQIIGENIFTYLVNYFSDKVEVDLSVDQKADEYQPTDTNLRVHLEKNGLTSVLLAEDFLEEYKIKTSFNSSDFVNHVLINCVDNNGVNYVKYHIYQYSASEFLGQTTYEGEVVDSKEIFVNNLAMIVFDFSDKRVISFVENTTEYFIETNLSMETAIELARSIK